MKTFTIFVRSKCSRSRVLLAALTVPVTTAGLVLGQESVALNVQRAVRLGFQSQTGKSYQLYRSADLGTWEKYGDILLGTGQEIDLTHVTENASMSVFRAETLTNVIRDLPDFKDYQGWKLFAKHIGPNPVLTGGTHGGTNVFKFIYVYPDAARLINGQMPIGAMLVKELHEDNNGQPGAITGALTIMAKRGGNFDPEGNGWEYFMTDTNLTETLLRGGSETTCFACHIAARDTDFVFSTAELETCATSLKP